MEYTPAQYHVEQERYLVTPARCEVVCDPPEYGTRRYEVTVRPGRWEWRRNPNCEIPCAPPPAEYAALQVEMQDSAESGAEEGIFGVGDVVRYELVVTNDKGSKSISGLKVVFTLPAELEFVSGGGDCANVTGAGRTATSAAFGLRVDTSCRMFVLCRVVAVPPRSGVRGLSGRASTCSMPVRMACPATGCPTCSSNIAADQI